MNLINFHSSLKTRQTNKLLLSNDHLNMTISLTTPSMCLFVFRYTAMDKMAHRSAENFGVKLIRQNKNFPSRSLIRRKIIISTIWSLSWSTVLRTFFHLESINSMNLLKSWSNVVINPVSNPRRALFTRNFLNNLFIRKNIAQWYEISIICEDER